MPVSLLDLLFVWMVTPLMKVGYSKLPLLMYLDPRFMSISDYVIKLSVTWCCISYFYMAWIKCPDNKQAVKKGLILAFRFRRLVVRTPWY